MTALQIAWKDIKFLLRSRTMLIFSILMPILMMIMMGYIFPSTNGQMKGTIGIYSENPLLLSMGAKNNDHFKIFKSKEDMIKALGKGEIDAAAIIPKDFLLQIAKGDAEIDVIPSPSNPQSGIMLSQMMAAMANNPTQQKNTKSKVHTKLVGLGGYAFNYYDFMSPGMMAMVAIMSVATGLAAAITRERELGTLDGLMVTPISRGQIVVGKILGQTIRGLVVAFIILGTAMLFFGVHIQGSILNVILLLLLGTFSFIGIGIIITASVRDQETAQVMMSTITFPMMFFSGVFFPVSQMPQFAHYISAIFPLTYAADALRKVMILGMGLKDVQNDIIILSMFAVVSTIVATLFFQKLIQD
jgi:ABC-2 type transport system permease protein